jgi:hypothetical protein
MNPNGNPSTLVAKQPGNVNALKSGAHSPRLIEARAAEIVSDLNIAEEFDELGKIALWGLARQVAMLEFIDRDLSERGLTDRNGKERYLLQRSERHVRLMNEAHDRVLEARASARKQKTIESPDHVVGNKADYVRALQVIALDHDPEARVSDRLAALKLLIGLGNAGTSGHFMPPNDDDPYADDPDIGGEVARLRDELVMARKDNHVQQLRNELDATRMGDL